MTLENFVLPRRVEKDPGSMTETYGEFHVEPLERGFGITLGNAIRRVLLSSLEGAAVWGVRIDDVLHEFSTIPGAIEDTAELVMNLKDLVLRLPDEVEQATMRMTADSRGELTAGDFEDTGQVEILNPDLHLLTLDEDRSFSMEVHVGRGRGYVAGNQHRATGSDGEHDLTKEIGFIPVDSIYSPVRRANFMVENTRVGQRTDYDRLTLQVTTNGALDPEVAVAEAAEILRTHFEYFLSFEEPGEEEEIELEHKHDRLKALFQRPVEELELSVRSGNCLKASNIRTLGDLVQRSESDMLQFRNFGKKSLSEISEVLQRHGLTFGMKVSGDREQGYELEDREVLRRLEIPEEDAGDTDGADGDESGNGDQA